MNENIPRASKASEIETANCPVCQQANQCQIEKGNDCWCVKEQIPKALIATLPKEKQGKSCLCQACVQRYNAAQALSVGISAASKADQ